MKVKKSFQHSGPRIIGMNLSLFVLGFVSILLCSCQQNSDDTSSTDNIENWAEHFFEERLSSISAESDTSCFYIGTEDGAFFAYNEDGIKKYNTPFDRIYCLKQDTTHRGYYWVGTRNMGLHYCKLVGDSLIKQQSYTIGVKNDRFSVYDICTEKDKDTLYLGTSHGLFAVSSRVPLSTGSSINLEQRWHRNKGDASPVVVGKLCPLNDELYFTTSVGIYKYNKGKNEAIISVPDTVTLPLLSRGQDGKIWAIIEDKLYTIHSSGYDCYDTIYIAHSVIDFVITPDYLYQVSKDSLYVTNLTSHTNDIGKRVLPSPARRECRNLIYDDVAHDQVLLVTSHHLLRLPHHYSLPTHKNVRVGISASCSDGDKAYFLFANKIFQLNPGDTVAKEKCSLNTSHHPSRITVYGDDLYYVAEKKVYCKNMDNGAEQFWALTNEPTALGSHKGNVYIGVRDSLLLLKDGQLKSDPIKLMRKNGSDQLEEANYPFITAFCQKGDSLLIATLNDGVYIGQDDHFEEAFSGDSLRFIRDIAIQGNNTFILTHRGLWRHSSDPQAASPHQYIDSKGFNHVLVNDQSVTLIADFGLREFMIHGDTVDTKYHDYYQDWSFRPELSLMKDSAMIISRNNGVLMINKPLDKSSKIHWLEFKPSWRLGDDWILVLTCIAVALALLALVSWLMHQKHRKELQHKEKEMEAKDKEIEAKEKAPKLMSTLIGKLSEIQSLKLPDFANIKESTDRALKSHTEAEINDEINKLSKIDSDVKTIKEFRLDYGKRKRKIQSIPEDILEHFPIIKTVNKLINSEPKTVQERSDTTEKINQFKNTSLNIDDVCTVLSSLNFDVDIDFDTAKEILSHQRKKIDDQIKKEIEQKKLIGWDMVDYLIDNICPLIIRHSMVMGFIDLRRIISDNINSESSLIRIMKESGNPKEIKCDYAIKKTKEGEKNELTDKQKELEAFVEELINKIEQIYQPWINGTFVDEELLQLLQPKHGLFKKNKKNIMNKQGVIITLECCGYDKAYRQGLMTALSCYYDNDTDTQYSSVISRFKKEVKIKDLEEYSERNPDSIAKIYSQAK